MQKKEVKKPIKRPWNLSDNVKTTFIYTNVHVPENKVLKSN